MPTKKDMILAAEIVSNIGITDDSKQRPGINKREAAAFAFAEYFAATNPRFDRERFLKACGV